MKRKREKQHALVLGLGRFGGGCAAVRFLANRGFAIRVADRAGADSLPDSVSALADIEQIEWCLGREDESVLDEIDLIVVNPGVPSGHALLHTARVRRIERTQEVDLFLEHYPGRVVLVTGTNGKSTTTTLLGAALAQAGRSVIVGGNIGRSLLANEEEWHPDQTAVLEISSFQLERLAAKARVSGTVLTRVTSDHLDRHGSIENYHAAKGRAAAAATEFVVHLADDAVAATFATEADRLLHGRPDTDAWIDADGFLRTSWHEDPGPILHRDALRLIGDFQCENVLAASLAAARLGVPRADYAAAMAMSAPLPHRLQCVAERNGVRLYDNGVSTELSSTVSAIEAIDRRIHWVGGGKSKDGNYAAVATAIAPRVASAHLFGAAAGPLSAALAEEGTDLTCTIHDGLERALDSAYAGAEAGDAILFSPAFTSFDQYSNFSVRAAAFVTWARRGLPQESTPQQDDECRARRDRYTGQSTE